MNHGMILHIVEDFEMNSVPNGNHIMVKINRGETLAMQ